MIAAVFQPVQDARREEPALGAPFEQGRLALAFRGLRRRALSGGLVGALVAPVIGRAQPGADWPRQPVRYINPFSAGGVVGAEAVARSRPNGTTIGLGTASTLAIAPALYAKLPYDPARDFTLVCGQWRSPSLPVVNKDLPARTVPELIAFLKADPGRHAFASAGTGSVQHLAGELFKRAAGVDVLHVPYRGGGQALLDLLAGRVQMQFDNVAGPLPAVREGKARALAVTGAQRNPALPDVPTLAEFLPDFEISSWTCVCGPAGLPRPVVERLSALSKRALESPDLVRGHQDLGAEAWWTTPEEIAAFRAAEEARLAPVVRASGARVD